jgi:hypothetical protein
MERNIDIYATKLGDEKLGMSQWASFNLGVSLSLRQY